MTLASRAVAGALALAVMCPHVARAQNAGDAATAQALFDEGKRLMQANRFAEACPKLTESQRLDPAPGTLLAAALCHEAEGRTATAWGEFTGVLNDARRERKADREALARDHIKALEAKMTRLRLVVTPGTPGIEVRRNGGVVGEPQWGSALPIDPGDHLFEARAPGKTSWTKTVTIQGEAQTVDVNVPLLENAPAEATPAVSPLRPLEPTPPATEAPRSKTHYLWAGVTAGVGVLAAGVGSGFGVAANAQWNEVQGACPRGQCRNLRDIERGEDAGKTADLSTAFFVVGAAALAVSAIILIAGAAQ